MNHTDSATLIGDLQWQCYRDLRARGRSFVEANLIAQTQPRACYALSRSCHALIRDIVSTEHVSRGLARQRVCAASSEHLRQMCRDRGIIYVANPPRDNLIYLDEFGDPLLDMEEGEIPCDLTTPVVATAADPTCALTAEQRMQYEEMIREFPHMPGVALRVAQAVSSDWTPGSLTQSGLAVFVRERGRGESTRTARRRAERQERRDARNMPHRRRMRPY